MPDFPPIPPQIKHVAPYMKVADELDETNIVISYFSRQYAIEAALNSISGERPPEVTTFVVSIIEWQDQLLEEHADLVGVNNSFVGHGMIQEYALQLFNYADSQDKAKKFGKNVVEAFYTAGILMDVLQYFEPLPDEMFKKRKYAQWKAVYIHNCLTLGEQPSPGPRIAHNLLEFSDKDEEEEGPSQNAKAEQPISSRVEPVDPPPINYPTNPVPITSPAPSPVNINEVPVPASRLYQNYITGVTLNAEQMEKAQKYCEWAHSGLIYYDVNTAIDNLQRALCLLQIGKEY